MKASILDLAKKRTVLLDGGMGTELFKKDFPMGTCPESWNTDKPEVVKEIHKSYFKAGSDAVLTNSFGGNKIKLSSYKLGKNCYELNRKAAELASKMKPEGKLLLTLNKPEVFQMAELIFFLLKLNMTFLKPFVPYVLLKKPQIYQYLLL